MSEEGTINRNSFFLVNISQNNDHLANKFKILHETHRATVPLEIRRPEQNLANITQQKPIVVTCFLFEAAFCYLNFQIFKLKFSNAFPSPALLCKFKKIF